MKKVECEEPDDNVVTEFGASSTLFQMDGNPPHFTIYPLSLRDEGFVNSMVELKIESSISKCTYRSSQS